MFCSRHYSLHSLNFSLHLIIIYLPFMVLLCNLVSTIIVFIVIHKVFYNNACLQELVLL